RKLGIQDFFVAESSLPEGFYTRDGRFRVDIICFLSQFGKLDPGFNSWKTWVLRIKGRFNIPSLGVFPSVGFFCSSYLAIFRKWKSRRLILCDILWDKVFCELVL